MAALLGNYVRSSAADSTPSSALYPDDF
jgi:hypothetical protein